MHHTPSIRPYGTHNTMRTLEALACGPLSAPDLAHRLGIDQRTARRLLQRLAQDGYARRGDWHHRRYAPTLRLAGLTRRLLDESPLLRLAAPTLAGLARGGATAALWVPAGDDATLCVLRCAPDDADPRVTLGERTPLSTCAAGLALLGMPGATAAPIHEHGERVAALTLVPGDGAVVATAAQTITELLRDGVL